MVRVGDFFERYAVGNDVTRFDVPRLDVLDQPRQVALDAGLVHAQRQALVHGVSNRYRIERRAIYPHDGDHSALANTVDAPVQHSRRTGLQFELDAGQRPHKIAGSFGAYRVNADICTHATGHLFN